MSSASMMISITTPGIEVQPKNFKDFIYLLLERGEGREKERRETSMYRRYTHWLPPACPQLWTWPATQAWALTGNQTGNLSVLRLVLSPLNHTNQGTKRSSNHGTQETWVVIIKMHLHFALYFVNRSSPTVSRRPSSKYTLIIWLHSIDGETGLRFQRVSFPEALSMAGT